MILSMWCLFLPLLLETANKMYTVTAQSISSISKFWTVFIILFCEAALIRLIPVTILLYNSHESCIYHTYVYDKITYHARCDETVSQQILCIISKSISCWSKDNHKHDKYMISTHMLHRMNNSIKTTLIQTDVVLMGQVINYCKNHCHKLAGQVSEYRPARVPLDKPILAVRWS